MGKGDKKTKRGKILMGSHGVRRPRRKAVNKLPELAVKAEIPVKAPKEKAAAKPKADKAEVPVELPEVSAPAEETVKPAKKKAPPKASKKEEKAEE